MNKSYNLKKKEYLILSKELPGNSKDTEYARLYIGTVYAL